MESNSDTEEDVMQHRTSGLKGLKNLGNTCYMNAALQALSNIKPIKDFFLKCSIDAILCNCRHNFESSSKCPQLALAFQKFMKEMWLDKREQCLTPADLMAYVKETNHFDDYMQHDSQEFLKCFIDLLHEELKVASRDIETESIEDEELKVASRDNGTESIEDEELKVASRDNKTESMEDKEFKIASRDNKTESIEDEDATGGEYVSDSECAIDGECATGGEYASDIECATDGEDATDGDDASDSEYATASEYATSSEYAPASEYATAGEYETAVSEHSSLSDNNNRQLVTHLTSSLHGDNNQQLVEHLTSTLHGHNYAKSKCVESCHGMKCDILNSSNRSNATNENEIEAIQIKSAPATTPKEVTYKSIISQVFDGKLSISVRCLSCNKVSTRLEKFQDLSLPLPNQDITLRITNMNIQTPFTGLNILANLFLNQFELFNYICSYLTDWLKGPVITLSDCLKAFFQEVYFKDDNQYRCENCNGLRDGVKTDTIKELPEVLCIHLKRFRLDMMFSKIEVHVAFPLESLDLTPYLHPNCKSQIRSYNLVSVICHHGSTSGGGHYTTFSFNSARKEWYEFDDKSVNQVPVEKVKSCEAYVLFYEKDNTHIVPERKYALNLKKNQANEFYVISSQWLTKFFSFGEPGPIDNSDFLCEHGNLLPEKQDQITKLMEFIPDSMWQYLYSRFGGGPVHRGEIGVCEICTQRLLDELSPRASEEFRRVYGEVYASGEPGRDPVELFFMSCRENFTHSVFYVNRGWFQSWYNFALNQSYILPGPINNSVLHTDNFLDHHFPLTYNQWRYLVSLYGGGPELSITPSRMDLTFNEWLGSSDFIAMTDSEERTPMELVREWLVTNDFLSVGDSNEELTTSASSSNVDDDCDMNEIDSVSQIDCMDFREYE